MDALINRRRLESRRQPGLVAPLFLVLAGCGSVGEPLYPALNIPTRVVDLGAVQRGDKIDIQFGVPKLTTEGLVLKQLGSVDLRIGPSPSGGFNANDWANGAQKIDVSPLPQPGAARVLEPVKDFAGKDLIIGVRLGNTKGRMSEWSNFVPIKIEAPLANPSDVKAEPVPEGVRVTWNQPGVSTFRILRKTGDQPGPSVIGNSDKPDYTDTTTEYGKTYQYYVEGIHDKTESETVASNLVTPQDIFPPAAPAGLAASQGVGAIELAWTRNTETDFKEYRVFRSEENGPFLQIAAGLAGPVYSDRKIESGKHYRYQVTAVDQTGNQSKPSEPIEITAP
ncbi:MAG TPA: hypothetical protein VKT81_18665 [Bryobacteraceae bacterium]|nr:hypothetical protein [Bryobacteraceae bacterium]